MNECRISGRLGQDPRTGVTKNGMKWAIFSIALNKKDKNSGEWTPTWWDIRAWDVLAESVEAGLKKGSKVCVTGAVKKEKYTDKHGVEKEKAYILAQEIWTEPLPSYRAKDSGTEPEAESTPPEPATQNGPAAFQRFGGGPVMEQRNLGGYAGGGQTNNSQSFYGSDDDIPF